MSYRAGLPLRTTLLYAASSLGSEALGQSRGLWLVYYYAPPADADLPDLLPITLVGVILTAGRLIESLDDVFVGYWSDRTRSRWGRRIPFVLAATPFWAIFGVLLFTPPAAGTAATALYLFAIIELFYLASTLSGGPYEALLPELATTSGERVRLAGVRVYFGAAGAGVGLVGSGLLVDHVGFAEMAIAMALLALICRYVGLAGVWRRASRTQAPAQISIRDALRATFSSRSFLSFLPTFVLFQIALQLMVGVLPYYVTAVLGEEDEGTWVAILTAVAIGSMLAAVPVFARLAARTTKRHAYSVAMLSAACLFPLLFFAGFLPGPPAELQILVTMLLVGAPLAGNYLFPATLTADIIDDDSARTGLRREATYFGAQNFVEKTATSFAPLLLTLLLLLGRTEDDPLGIRLVGPVAGAVVLGAYVAFRSYDLADQVRARVEPGR
jgi:GPH family glycoside/pentoside/hexuronide:cation symporter